VPPWVNHVKNQYFGDVNDYRKYGLLRILQKVSDLRIGVCWCLTPDDGGGHGEVRSYLGKPHRWRQYDHELYDKLQRLNDPSLPRSVQLAREWGIIPRATYFEALLGSSAADRTAYFDNARTALGGCDLMFLDPDNGIEVKATRWGAAGAQKYVYWRELKAIFAQGQSLLVYQHFPRVVRERFVPFLAGCLREELDASIAMAFETAQVAFFLVPQPGHASVFARAAEDVAVQWSGQIEALTLPSSQRAAGVTLNGADIVAQRDVASHQGPNTAAFLADYGRYFANSYAQFCAFGGPCVHFHQECLRAGEQEFLSDRHLEMLYATLTAWGMHRMGNSDRTKTKLVEWKAFRDSLRADGEVFERLRHLRLLDLSDMEYADVLRKLEPVYRRLKLSEAGATIVVNSKALFHLLPHLVPPIDRQYTVRFFTQTRERWRDATGKFRMVMLPPSLDAQVDLFRTLCLEIKRLADQVDPDIFAREFKEHKVTAPKAIDNAIVSFVRSQPKEAST
jgi:hypothetical protein